MTALFAKSDCKEVALPNLSIPNATAVFEAQPLLAQHRIPVRRIMI